MIDALNKAAHKEYLSLVRTRKPRQKKIRKAIGKQLGYLARNLRSIDTFLSAGNLLTARQQLRLETIRKVYEQTEKHGAQSHSFRPHYQLESAVTTPHCARQSQGIG